MIVWVALILYLIALRPLTSIMSKRASQDKNYLIFAGLGVVLLLGLRYPAYPPPWNDLLSYYSLYEQAIDVPFVALIDGTRMEWGYVLFVKVLASLVPWPQFLFFVQATIGIGCSFYFISKYSADVFLATLFFVTLGVLGEHMTGFRQSIAVSICLLAVQPAKRRQWFRFGLLVMLACTFHRTALIFCLFYLFTDKQLTFRLIFKYLTLFVLFGLFIGEIVALGNLILGVEYEQVDYSLLGSIISLSIAGIALILRYFGRDVKNDSICINLTIIWFFLYISRYYVIIMERLSSYFMIGVSICLANAIWYFKGKRNIRMLLYIGTILATTMLFFYRMMRSDAGHYVFLWNEPWW